MAQQTINIGTVANDGTGDPLRTAFDKANDNFTELYGFGGDISAVTAGDGLSGGGTSGDVSLAVADNGIDMDMLAGEFKTLVTPAISTNNFTMDFSLGSNFIATLGDGVSECTLSNLQAGDVKTLVAQNTTGGTTTFSLIFGGTKILLGGGEFDGAQGIPNIIQFIVIDSSYILYSISNGEDI